MQARRAALLAEGRGAGHAGRVAFNRERVELERDIRIIHRRIAAASAEVADLFGNRSRTPAPGGEPEKTETAEKASAAERYAASLERAIAAARELTHEERALGEIRSGRLGEVTAARAGQRILALARERDLLEAMRDEEAALADERERAAREAEAAAARHAGAVADIERAGEALASPYTRAIAEIDRWRDQVLARLEEGVEGHEAYAERVVEVNEIAAERIDRAWEEEAERRLRESRRWEDGVTRALRGIADEAGDYGELHGGRDQAGVLLDGGRAR